MSNLILPASLNGRPVVPGVDLSHWEPDTDFGLLYAAGVRFVITKATDGVDGVDPKWADFRSKASLLSREHDDFFFGGFHFFEPGQDPAKQAAHFLSIVRPVKGDIIPSLDTETAGANVGAESWAFDQAFVKATGYHSVLYTDEPFYLAGLKAAGFGAAIAAGHMRFWLARYRSEPPATASDIWQFSDAGKVPGEPKTMDADVFFGDVEQFRARMLVG
jgi:lysozyme